VVSQDRGPADQRPCSTWWLSGTPKEQYLDIAIRTARGNPAVPVRPGASEASGGHRSQRCAGLLLLQTGAEVEGLGANQDPTPRRLRGPGMKQAFRHPRPPVESSSASTRKGATNWRWPTVGAAPGRRSTTSVRSGPDKSRLVTGTVRNGGGVLFCTVWGLGLRAFPEPVQQGQWNVFADDDGQKRGWVAEVDVSAPRQAPIPDRGCHGDEVLPKRTCSASTVENKEGAGSTDNHPGSGMSGRQRPARPTTNSD